MPGQECPFEDRLQMAPPHVRIVPIGVWERGALPGRAGQIWTEMIHGNLSLWHVAAQCFHDRAAPPASAIPRVPSKFPIKHFIYPVGSARFETRRASASRHPFSRPTATRSCGYFRTLRNPISASARFSTFFLRAPGRLSILARECRQVSSWRPWRHDPGHHRSIRFNLRCAHR